MTKNFHLSISVRWAAMLLAAPVLTSFYPSLMLPRVFQFRVPSNKESGLFEFDQVLIIGLELRITTDWWWCMMKYVSTYSRRVVPSAVLVSSSFRLVLSAGWDETTDSACAISKWIRVCRNKVDDWINNRISKYLEFIYSLGWLH
jgi:hypothetical protein